MGYASNRPVSGGEFDDGGLEGYLHRLQFAPSSTAVRGRRKQPGLGFTPSFGILTDPAGYNAPKTTTTTAPTTTSGTTSLSTLLGQAKTLFPPIAPLPTPLPVPYTPPPTTSSPSPSPSPSPIPPPTTATGDPIIISGGIQPITAGGAQDNATTLAQQAAAAAAAGNSALASALSAQAQNWGGISASMAGPTGDDTSQAGMTMDPTNALVAAKSISPEILIGIAAIAWLLTRKK